MCGVSLIRLQAWRSGILLKRNSNTGFFPADIEKFLRTPILKNICERLLQSFVFQNCNIAIRLSSFFVRGRDISSERCLISSQSEQISASRTTFVLNSNTFLIRSDCRSCFVALLGIFKFYRTPLDGCF